MQWYCAKMSGPPCLQQYTIAMRADTHGKVQETEGNSILVWRVDKSSSAYFEQGSGRIETEYAGTKVEYEPCRWSAHTVECLPCRQPLIVGSLFVYCEDH
jgi:hypothetical protein